MAASASSASHVFCFFFFNDTATTEIYTLSLHDALPILATSRKWLVTSLWAASLSPCSRQLLASMYSSWGSNIGNRRISSRYLVRPVSPDRTGKAAVWAMTSALSLFASPLLRQTVCRRFRKADGASCYLAPAAYTVRPGD